MTQTNQTISWKEVIAFLSPTGQQQLVDFVRQAREERGAGWLPEIQAEFPTFSWIVELVCTKSPREAVEELQVAYPSLPLWMIESQLTKFHEVLKTEIERKR